MSGSSDTAENVIMEIMEINQGQKIPELKKVGFHQFLLGEYVDIGRGWKAITSWRTALHEVDTGHPGRAAQLLGVSS